MDLLSLLLLPVAVAADDLYDPAPPADAAFVRVVNATAAAAASRVGDKDFGVVGPAEASPYRVVAKGERAVQIGAARADLSVAAGSFYTLALDGGGQVHAVTDPTNTNLARTLLVLYNFSEAPSAALKTADGGTEIIGGVAPDGHESRVVNPLKVDLAAFVGDQAVGTFAGLSLGRGAAYSVIVTGAADAPKAVWVQNQTSTK